MVKQLRAVMHVTRIELLAHPVILLLIFVPILLTLITPIFQFQQFSQDGRLARDCGLASFFLFGVAITLFGAVRTVTGELHTGVAAATLSKPLSRHIWLMGKWFGITAVLLTFACSSILAVMLAEAFSPHYQSLGRYVDWPLCLSALGATLFAMVAGAVLNRNYGMRLTLCATHILPFALAGVAVIYTLLSPEVPLKALSLQGGVLLFFGLIQVLAIAICFASRLTLGSTISATLAVFVLGFYLRLPDFRLFWQLDALSYQGISWYYLLGCAGYAMVTSALFLNLGSAGLRQRELA